MIPDRLGAALDRAHPSWRPILEQGLCAIAAADPSYLPDLVQSEFLPTGDRLFAAFSLPPSAVRHVLIGEGPFPRAESATGVCFMDGAVDALWSENGLSTRVNRATSLRNFIKMLLVCEGTLDVAHTTGEPLAAAARRARAPENNYIQSLPELQHSLQALGFLLLNATLVYRPGVAPAKDGQAWRPFLQVVLRALADSAGSPPTLILWGKVAQLVSTLEGIDGLPRIVAEHPYNLSFIANPAMHALFRPFRLLQRRAPV